MSLQDDISLEIPLDPIVVKYLGFMPLNYLEFASDLANPKYLTSSSKGNPADSVTRNTGDSIRPEHRVF